MTYRRLGSSGLFLSAVGLGTYLTVGERLDEGESEALVRAALDMGVNYIDTADTYANGRAEEILGRILQGVDRSSWVIATKCFFPVGALPMQQGLSRKHLVDSVHASLKRLRTDYLDLLQCHRFDPETSLEETLDCLDDLRSQGKILYWGVTRWPHDRVSDATRLAKQLGTAGPVSHQTFLSLANRSNEWQIALESGELGLGILAHSPLAQGVLTGKYSPEQLARTGRASDSELRATMFHLDPATVRKSARLAEIARSVGCSAASLAIAWVLGRPGVTSALVGASTPAQIRENAGASDHSECHDVFPELDSLFPPPSTV